MCLEEQSFLRHTFASSYAKEDIERIKNVQKGPGCLLLTNCKLYCDFIRKDSFLDVSIFILVSKHGLRTTNSKTTKADNAATPDMRDSGRARPRQGVRLPLRVQGRRLQRMHLRGK